MKGELSIRFLLAALTLLGWGTLIWMPFGVSPASLSTAYRIVTPFPFAGPRVVEQDVTAPIEAALSSVRGIEEISSVSRAGMSEVSFDLREKGEREQVIRQVRSVIRTLARDLPPEAGYPELSPDQLPAQEPSLDVVVYSRMPEDSLTRWLQPAMALVNQRLNGAIREIRYPNAVEAMTLIKVDPARAAESGLTAAAILQQIQSLTTIRSWTTHPDQTIPVRWTGIRKMPDRPTLLPLSGRQQAPVLLGDLADITETHLPAACRRVNGRPVFTMQIDLQAEAASNPVVRKLCEELERLETASGGKVEFALLNNPIRLMQEHRNLVLAQCAGSVLLLTLMLIWLYSWRHVSFLLLSLAATTGVTLLLLFLLKKSMSLEVLGGLTLGLGLVVDNSMMLMAMSVHSSRGKRMTPLVGATLSTMIPLVLVYRFQPGEMAMLTGFAETLLIMLASGLLINWVTMPLITGLSVSRTETSSGFLISASYSSVRWQRTLRWPLLIGMILLLGIPLPDLPEKLEKGHRWESLYARTIGSGNFLHVWQPRIQAAVGGVIRPFLLKVDQHGRPGGTNSAVKVSLSGTMEEGTPPILAQQVARELEQAILDWNPGYRLLDVTWGPGPELEMEIVFSKEQEQAGWPARVQQFLRMQVNHYSGITWSLHGVGEGWSNWNIETAGYYLQFSGYHIDRLMDLVAAVRDTLESRRGIVKIKVDQEESDFKPGYNFIVNQAGIAWAASGEVNLGQGAGLADRRLSSQGYFPSGGGWRPYCVRESGFDRQTVSGWLAQPATDKPGAGTRGDFLLTDQILPVSAIVKEQQQYQMTLSWSYVGSERAGDRLFESLLEAVRAHLPAGFRVEGPDENWAWDASLVDGLLWMLPVVVLVYVLCAVIMESWRLPLLVLLTIPMAYVGPMLAVGHWEVPFGEGMMSGFFLLTGLMVNHAIFLLLSVRSCFRLTAGKLSGFIRQKTTPMLLTALSTCLTFGPFLIWAGSDSFWYQLAVGMVSGVVSGTGLFFLVIPGLIRIAHD